MNVFIWTLVVCGLAGVIKSEAPPDARFASANGEGNTDGDRGVIARFKRFGFPIPLPQFHSPSYSGNLWDWNYGSSNDNYYSNNYRDYYYYDGSGYYYDDQYDDYTYSGNDDDNPDDNYYNYDYSVYQNPDEPPGQLRDAQNAHDGENNSHEDNDDNNRGKNKEENNDVKARGKRFGFPIPLPGSGLQQREPVTVIPWPTQTVSPSSGSNFRRGRYGSRGRHGSSGRQGSMTSRDRDDRRRNRRRCRENPDRRRCRNRRGRKRKSRRD